jgi:DNA-binding MarR family transcriptional regulator
MTRNQVDPHFSTDSVLLARYKAYRGLQQKVAKRLKVHKSIVSRVARGLKKSERIEKALLSEARRIERSIEKARIGEEAA